MNTPAHLIIGLAAFSKPKARAVSCAAFLGALLPDLSLYLLVAWARWVENIPDQVIFSQYYFSDAWQRIFAIDNSVLLWGAILAFGLWRRSAVIIALAGAALLHIALDLPLHHDDGRAHFWPVTSWVFESPLSYWDRAQGALWIAPLETLLVLVLCLVLLVRHKHWAARLGVVVLGAAQISTAYIWAFVFAG